MTITQKLPERKSERALDSRTGLRLTSALLARDKHRSLALHLKTANEHSHPRCRSAVMVVPICVCPRRCCRTLSGVPVSSGQST